jgi:hypothetical protein
MTDPNTFQSTALQWIGVATILAGAIAGFVGAILGYIAKIRAEAADKFSQANHAASTASIQNLQKSVNEIALSTPSATITNVNQPTEPKQ